MDYWFILGLLFFSSEKKIKLIGVKMKWECIDCGCIMSYHGDTISYKPICSCEPIEHKTGLMDIDRISSKITSNK